MLTIMFLILKKANVEINSTQLISITNDIDQVIDCRIQESGHWKPFLEKLPPVSGKQIIIKEVCGSKEYYSLTTIRDQHLLDCMIRGAQMSCSCIRYWRNVENVG